ncbi:GNAT family N-acetyltransferase, partial [Crossiella equi]
AQDGERVLARARWWGFAHGEHPLSLDYLHLHPDVADPAALAGDLIAAAHAGFRARGMTELPDYHLKLPLGWREDPAAVAAVAVRRAAAARAGLTDENERLRFEWTPEAGVPNTTSRLVFRPEPDDDVVLPVFRALVEGSLDVATRRGVAASGAEALARDDLAFYRDEMPAPREWWRLAYAGDELVGLAIPSRNPHNAVVGYLGVLPEHRGNGYIHEVLAHITRHHAELGVPRVLADTDTVNRPMAAAFERGGYRNIEMRLVLSAPV